MVLAAPVFVEAVQNDALGQYECTCGRLVAKYSTQHGIEIKCGNRECGAIVCIDVRIYKLHLLETALASHGALVAAIASV